MGLWGKLTEGERMAFVELFGDRGMDAADVRQLLDHPRRDDIVEEALKALWAGMAPPPSAEPESAA